MPEENYAPDPRPQPLQWTPSQELGGSGSGSGQVLQDATGAPPPDPTQPAISYDTGGGPISQWDVASQAWV